MSNIKNVQTLWDKYLVLGLLESQEPFWSQRGSFKSTWRDWNFRYLMGHWHHLNLVVEERTSEGQNQPQEGGYFLKFSDRRNSSLFEIYMHESLRLRDRSPMPAVQRQQYKSRGFKGSSVLDSKAGPHNFHKFFLNGFCLCQYLDLGLDVITRPTIPEFDGWMTTSIDLTCCQLQVGFLDI